MSLYHTFEAWSSRGTGVDCVLSALRLVLYIHFFDFTDTSTIVSVFFSTLSI